MTTASLGTSIRGAGVFGVQYVAWLKAHRGATTIAGLLSFAVPVTFLPGAIVVMRAPTTQDVLALAAWFGLFGVELWSLLLLLGYATQRFDPQGRYARSSALASACAAAALTEWTSGRGNILLEQGVVQSSQSMHVYGFTSALIMALLFFAHLHRSRAHELAAVRLSVAQAAQRETRRRLVQARLQALQARIDPNLLFEMLDSVRRAYQDDPARAERLLDKLVEFLRAALPRLRNASSSLQREAELARAYVRLRALAESVEHVMTLNLAGDVVDACFPPGVLLPLLDDALRRRPGDCKLSATLSGTDCCIALVLPACPRDTTVGRVRSLLADVYGSLGVIATAQASGAAVVTVRVPYQHV